VRGYEKRAAGGAQVERKKGFDTKNRAQDRGGGKAAYGHRKKGDVPDGRLGKGGGGGRFNAPEEKEKRRKEQ